MKIKIFITGSSGFIGFHVAKKYLDKGLKVHGLDSMNNYYDVKIKKARLKILKKYRNFSFTRNKLENKIALNKSFKKFKPTITIHLAAQHLGIPKDLIDGRSFYHDYAKDNP